MKKSNLSLKKNFKLKKFGKIAIYAQNKQCNNGSIKKICHVVHLLKIRNVIVRAATFLLV